jgi:hypothetical protein
LQGGKLFRANTGVVPAHKRTHNRKKKFGEEPSSRTATGANDASTRMDRRLRGDDRKCQA